MKKYIAIMALGLSLVITSCGNEQPEETTEITEPSSSKTYALTEVGEFEGTRLDRNYEGITIFAVEGEQDLYGALDSDGNVVLEPQEAYLSYGDGLLTMARENEEGAIRYSYADIEGTPVIEMVEGVEIVDGTDFEDGYALVTLNNELGEGRNFGSYSYLINKDGEVIIQAQSKDTALVRDGDYILELGGETGIVEIYNLDGSKADKEVFEDENYDADNVYESDGIYFIRDEEDNVNYSYAIYDNESEKAVTDYVYTFYEPAKVGDNYLVTKISENPNEPNYVLIDNMGNEVFQISETYKNIMYPDIVNDKIIINPYEGDAIVLDENGNVYKETTYDVIDGLIGSDIMLCAEGEYLGLLDSEFNPIVEPIYDDVVNAYDDKALLLKDGILYKVAAQ